MNTTPHNATPDGAPVKVYILGPMRGIKHYNAAEFDRMADWLRCRGYHPVSPVDIDRAHGFDPYGLPADTDWNKVPDGLPLADIVRRDLEQLQTCQAVAKLLGWRQSVGARAESAVAEWLGLPVVVDLDATAFDEPIDDEGAAMGIVARGERGRG